MLTRSRLVVAVLVLAAGGLLASGWLRSGYRTVRAWLRGGEAALVLSDPPTPNRPHLGINLTHIADWGRELSLVDVFKPSRAWFERGLGPFTYDAHGNPFLRPGQSVWTLAVRELDGHYPGGRYVATYQGRGRVEINRYDVTRVVSERPGRIEFDVTPGHGGIEIVVAASAPDDPIRDIHVWMPGFEGASSPFYPPFLERLTPFEALRFVGWQKTIDSPVQTWDQRAKPEDARYSTPAGAPLELLINLANERLANPWFCIPHRADDDFVRHFAEQIREKLRPELKVYVEYSNEVWNPSFQESRYAEEQGRLLGLGKPEGPRFYAQRSVEIFRIFEEVFGGRERLVRVLATQFVNPWLSEQILTWHDAYQHADALAVGAYFGGALGDPSTAKTVAALPLDQLFDRLRTEVDGTHRNLIRQQAQLARQYHLELIAYEGGQGLVGYQGAEDNEALTVLLIAANRDPRMYDLTKRHLSHWFAAGGGMFMTFNYVTAPNKWGSWGQLEYQDQPLTEAHKYRAVLDVLKESVGK